MRSLLPSSRPGCSPAVNLLMVFDKNAHFCLNAMKASVADETTIVTIRHDDVDELGKSLPNKFLRWHTWRTPSTAQAGRRP